MSYNADDGIIRLSSLGYTCPTSFSNEASGLRLPMRLDDNGDSPPSPSSQYRMMHGRNNQHSLFPAPCVLMSSASQQNRVMCFADTLPSLAINAMPANEDLANDSGYSDKTLDVSAASSSIAVPIPEVLNSQVKKVDSDIAEFVRITSTQVMDQPANPSVQPNHETAFHDLEQQSKAKSSISSMASTSARKEPKKSKKSKPKRALTAYNLFFQEQRQVILKDRRLSHVEFHNGSKRGKRKQSCHEDSKNAIGFAEMGKIIGQRWQELDIDLRRKYETKAEAEKRRYREELAQHLLNERNEREARFASLQASVSEDTKHRYFSGGK